MIPEDSSTAQTATVVAAQPTETLSAMEIPAPLNPVEEPVITPVLDTPAPETMQASSAAAAQAAVNDSKPVVTAKTPDAVKPSIQAKPAVKSASKVASQPAPKKVKTAQNNVLDVKLEPQNPPKTVASAPKSDPKDKPGIVSQIVDATKGLINHAFSWLGTRYVWGGNTKKGVDCSGLTRQLYKKEGIPLPHNAKQQFKRGQAVAKNNLLPGDLVFFNTRGPITHVGVYIGNNEFLHAANPRKGVRVDKLNSAYYSKRYAGARRYKSTG